MTRVLNIIMIAPSLILSFLGALLKFVNEGIKPITDKTKTNKDNVIQAKISSVIEIAITWIGKIQTLINKFN